MIHNIKICTDQFNLIISKKQYYVSCNNPDVKVNDVVVMEDCNSNRKASRKVRSIVNGVMYLKSIND